MLKVLFLNFGKNGIFYKHFTNFIISHGTYTTVLKGKFLKISEERIDFGSLPNRSAIDMASFSKITTAVMEGWIWPYENFSHLMMIVNFLLGVMFMLCGRKEHVTLIWSNIRISNVT